MANMASQAMAILASTVNPSSTTPCDSVQHGYRCQPDVSQFWGQYSPFFSVPSEISADIPHECSVTFAQILSRHGARDPTARKTEAYSNTISKLHQNVNPSDFQGPYAFLSSYEYTLGADQLTHFGQQEMINSGIKFFDRYEELATNESLFIRSAGEARVVESARNWSRGFHQAKISSPSSSDATYPYPILILSEEDGFNNSLNHGLCTAFEEGPVSSIADDAQQEWTNIFVPSIQARLNGDLPGAKLTATEAIYLMDLCPFDTVASDAGSVSPFCKLFTRTEWRQYNHYESLNKYYGYGGGNPLGPTQGVGFANELIARLTGQEVVDHTSTNTTLDSNPTTFPLDRKLYADFGHDNDMTAVFFALGLYNETAPLSNTSVETIQQTEGYSAAWTVPFAARMYVEKLRCGTADAGASGHEKDHGTAQVDPRWEEYVRVIVNDRVLPLDTCGGDDLGRCTVGAFVESLSFASTGGSWDKC